LCIRGQNKAFRSVFVVLLAIRQQHYRKPSAAVGDRFIVPAYT